MDKRLGIAVVVAVLLGGLAWAVALRQKDGASVHTPSAASVNQLLEEAAGLESQGERFKVKEIYSKIVTDYPEYDKVAEIQEKLGNLNVELIYSNTMTPQSIPHQVVPGDSLGKLAKQYKTTKELIKKSNGLKSDVIRVGQTLRVWNATFNILVDKSQNLLFLKTGDEIVKVYHVSTGVNNITPAGNFKIATKLEQPVWFKPGSAPIPSESPENVLGSRWMGFDTDPHYGIHGTTEPDKIGQQVTAGCVRMLNREVEELFDLLPAGTAVVIQD